MWANFIKMPKALRFLVGGIVVLPIFIVESIMPGRTIAVAGEFVSSAKWWNEGAGIISIFVGTLFVVAALQLLRRSSSGRITYVAAWLILSASSPYIVRMTSEAPTFPLATLLPNLVLTALIAAYLFLSAEVREYLEK